MQGRKKKDSRMKPPILHGACYITQFWPLSRALLANDRSYNVAAYSGLFVKQKPSFDLVVHDLLPVIPRAPHRVCDV